MSRAGFLWDSLSNNTGDQAVGLTLMRLARRAGMQGLEPVSIGESLAERYELLVIGGGELLHPPGHPFYDLFRVPGEHVLNTVGTYGEVEASYLSSYRLITVRSAADRDNLRGLAREARVAPCLSVLFGEIAEDRPVMMGQDPLLLHLHAGVFLPGTASALVSLLRRLEPPVAMLPFTHHNCDGALQAVLAAAAGLPAPLEVAGPDQAFAAIRRARAVIVTSLHAAIFAYVAGVPFLAMPYSPKVRHFLAERGLERRLLPDIQRLPEKLHLLTAGSVDWQSKLATDVAAARATATEILGLVEETLARPDGSRVGLVHWTEPTHPEQAHAQAIGRHADYGRRMAQVASDELAGRHAWRRSIASAARILARSFPAIRRLGWARALWRRWTGAYGI
ncbi:MAG: polysaccharide pyruvyl transferase family protein [Acidobacteria bacterium]|nr:polysaccharide pyruvyl transferase family protein [Acidobacteriota bacterium]